MVCILKTYFTFLKLFQHCLAVWWIWLISHSFLITRINLIVCKYRAKRQLNVFTYNVNKLFWMHLINTVLWMNIHSMRHTHYFHGSKIYWDIYYIYFTNWGSFFYAKLVFCITFPYFPWFSKKKALQK